LKNLEIGYSLPEKLIRPAHIDRLRFYFSGANLLTFTDMVDYDPERRATDIRASSYPQSKVFSIGFNISF